MVDGGSMDRTIPEARATGAKVVALGRKGRARQMNAGAGRATGDLLLFLHADTSVSADTVAALRASFADPRTVLVGQTPWIEHPEGCKMAMLSAHNFCKVRRRTGYGVQQLSLSFSSVSLFSLSLSGEHA